MCRESNLTHNKRLGSTDSPSVIEMIIRLPERFGKLLVRYNDGKLTEVRFMRRNRESRRRTRARPAPQKRDTHLERKLAADFRAYFSGRKVTFDYAVDTERFTTFQKAVWAAMTEIPYGETRSYRWIAETIGKPRAYRAVGNACRKNPLLIVQPCHRVTGSEGKLGGFSAGLDLKKTLLDLEGVHFRCPQMNKRNRNKSIYTGGPASASR